MTTSSSMAPGRRSLPHDVSELITQYGEVLGDLLKNQQGKTVQELAEELVRRGTLTAFPVREFLPPIMSVPQTLDLLGARWNQWVKWQYHCKKGCKTSYAKYSELCPDPIIGSRGSRFSEYAAKDILRIFQSPKKFSDDAPIYPEETVRAFGEFLKAASERISYDWSPKSKPLKPKRVPETNKTKTLVRASKPEAFVGWPIGVPRNYDALYREHRGFVQRTLLTYLKPCPSQQIEDVEQHIWMKIIESKTIEKFVSKARYRKIAKKVTAAEAVEYLGITWDQWLDLVRQDPPWLQPVEGLIFSNSALFTAEQIRNVEESGLFPIVDAIPADDMTKVFRGYLRNAIHNHFANYCRTRVRRFVKDLVVPADNSRVVRGAIVSALEGDDTPWEDALEDRDCDRPDAACDLPEVNSVEALNFELSEQIGRINRFVPSSRHEQVFSLIADGCPIRDAIAQVRAAVEMHRNSLRVAEG